jgi:Holliday junction resolvase YEN1
MSKLGKSGSHALAIQFKKFVSAFGMEWHEVGDCSSRLNWYFLPICIGARWSRSRARISQPKRPHRRYPDGRLWRIYIWCPDNYQKVNPTSSLLSSSLNPTSISSKLSGNKGNLAKNSKDKTDNYHTMLYTATDINDNPTVAMSRGGLILFALLSGGDYHKVCSSSCGASISPDPTPRV